MALDSKAAFQLRASEIGIQADAIALLETGGIANFSQFAFCCAYQPGSANEDALFEHLETVLGTKPVGAAASNFRRLFFECHAMALRDLQSRLDRSDTSEIKILPLAEKVQRLENLKAKFPGVMLSTTLGPSHNLIDKVVHQFEDNCVKLIELNACTSREQEIRCDKTSPQITFDHSGNIKVTKQSQVTECSIQGEIRLRAAFTRRSLAYELAAVASFEVMETWSQLLFDRMCQEPPSGYKHISIEQVMVADRKLWVKVSEDTRSRVTGTTDGKKNVDIAIQKFSHHPDVQFHMLPLPLNQGGGAASSNQRFQPYPAAKGPPQHKGKGGQKADGKGAPGKGKIQVPDGCVVKFGEGNNKPICMKYNVGACRTNVKPGKRCMHGYHVCWKVGCHRNTPFHECSHAGSS